MLFNLHFYRLLNYSLDDQIIAKQNTYPLLSSLAGNTNGKTILWNFYYDHLLSINTSLGESYYMLLPLGRAICRNFIHENDKQKVFFNLI